MPLITSSKTAATYDVIVVGSGAAGGQTAYTLALEGAKVLMLEAGRNYDPVRETPMFQLDGQAPLRGTATPDKAYGFYDATVDGGWEIAGEPYTNASTDPERQFNWWRARMLGGRTNHWGRNSLRYGPHDFKPRSRDGLGFDWPLSYEELAPYYDRVEMLIGVYGSNEGLENIPDSSPGVLLPPPKLRAGELLVQQRGKKLGLPPSRSTALCLPCGRTPTDCPPNSIRTIQPRSACSPLPCGTARRACGRPPALAAARSRPPTSRPRSTCRRHSQAATSTS